MPQLNKGGKYVFGWSLIRNDGIIQFPQSVLDEYHLTNESRIIIFTGSKVAGGFCVTTEQMLSVSKLSGIIKNLPQLSSDHEYPGAFFPYKGRYYAWLPLSKEGTIKLPQETMRFLHLEVGNKLMSIRSSNIAFTMGAKGPLLERGRSYQGYIKTY